jgi:DNA polymerase
MNYLFLDYETWSKVNIRRGTDVYMANAKPLILVYALNDGPVRLHDFTTDSVISNEFFSALRHPEWVKVAHNAFFDRMVTDRLVGIPTPVKDWHCTQAQALAHSLPGGLSPLCQVLGVPDESAKDADGKRLIRKFCGPKPLVKDEEWQLFIQYAIKDVIAMRECMKRMPNWNYLGHEKQVWNVDQTINNRGFMIDKDLAVNAVDALKLEKKRLNQQTFELTDSAVGAATQRDKLLLYLMESQGVIMRDLRAPTIEEVLAGDGIDEGTRLLLKIRLQSAKASPSKYVRVLDCVGADNRLRGTLQYSGANRTARWAGRMFQPQNLLRPTMEKHDIRACIDLIRTGNAAAVPMFANLNTACANATRGLIVAPDGQTLQGADYSSIEGRGNAWIAGEKWKIEAFKEGKDMYKLIYARAFDIKIEDVSKGNRQKGKVMELALGYQGGVGAFLNMAGAYNMDLNELGETVKPTIEAQNNYEYALEQHRDYGLPSKVWIACETLKLGYRKGNPAITQLWFDLEVAAKEAIRNPLKQYQVGMLMFDANNEWLRIKLPSGRYLCYALPRIHADNKISYMAWRNRAWRRTSTYGGKLDENIVQAISRDILAAALVRLDVQGYRIVLHVHDEALAEVDGRPLEEFVRTMIEVPEWAAGFPIAAEGFELKRYEKT